MPKILADSPMMKTGLVLGKFMPLHKGHLALIDYARARCDRLIVLLCAQDNLEPIPGAKRKAWLQEALRSRADTELVFTDVKLPNTSESSQEISRLWANWIAQNLPPVDIFFSSEPYGAFLAEYLHIQHNSFNPERDVVPVSGTAIRENPLKFWEFLARPARPYFLRKVAVIGTESTGKSTMAIQLAAHFNTIFVPEAARDIVAHSNEVTEGDLYAVAAAHSAALEAALPFASRLLISDTDMHTTRIYGQFLFDKTLEFPAEVEQNNDFDLYLLLTPEVPFVQDGTRMEEARRNALHEQYLRYFTSSELPWRLISGANWDSRVQQAITIIQKSLF